jgi:hypothetical protein
VLKKKIWANFQTIIELFIKKIVKKLLKVWSWDPGSRIRDPGSGMGKNQDPGSGINIPDPQHWFLIKKKIHFGSAISFFVMKTLDLDPD